MLFIRNTNQYCTSVLSLSFVAIPTQSDGNSSTDAIIWSESVVQMDLNKLKPIITSLESSVYTNFRLSVTPTPCDLCHFMLVMSCIICVIRVIYIRMLWTLTSCDKVYKKHARICC